MKLTSLTFLAAVVLFLIALASGNSRIEPSPEKTLALDFSGIETLRVVSPQDVEIHIADRTSRVQYQALEGGGVDVRREGSTLIVDVHTQGYMTPEISIPPTVSAIEIAGRDWTGSARIDTTVALEALVVRAAAPVSWTGDVTTLRIDGHPDTSACAGEYCDGAVTITAGRIQSLTISLPSGDVRLHTMATGQTRLLLGAEATFSVTRAKKLGELSIEPYPAAPIASPSPFEPTKTPE